MENHIAEEFIRESQNQFKDSFKRLFHCLDQLNDQQLWWQANDKMNSVAVLVKHVCGNMRQWIVSSITNVQDKRNRPAEFVNDGSLTKPGLLSVAKNLESDFTNAITNLNSSRLTEQRRIQGHDVTLMGAIFHALTHLEGHIGQIVFLTRIQLGDNYKILWTPQTEEQSQDGKKTND